MILKCKMCGGDLIVSDGTTVCECEYCGTQQTISSSRDEVISNLYNRANNLRRKCEFDRAEAIYNKIVEKDDSEAEAHWGIVLCKYGIEYVEDPNTAKMVPTCHRTLFEAIRTDADFQAAIDFSDTLQQSIYEKEAIAIDKLQKNILEIVKNEKPFDVFICYKETDENGKRTVDSSIANDIYYQLTEQGFKVFYAAITLEDKLGQEFEPYIFAALNSAKVMLVVGTNPMYFNAVWVKNEWSRYLKLMKTHRDKLLIPCYRDMDAYELPEEFSHLQSQDMGKIGFINDVVRGIKKVIVKEDKQSENKTVVVKNQNSKADSLLKRAFMFLEDRDWKSADEYCEKVLDIDPENAQAYLGKLMAELGISHKFMLKSQKKPYDNNNNYQKAYRFGDEQLKSDLDTYTKTIKERVENERIEGIYSDAVKQMKKAKTKDEFDSAAKKFKSINTYKDSDVLVEKCIKQGEEALIKSKYREAKQEFNRARNVNDCDNAIKLFEKIIDYKDSKQQIEECKKRKNEFIKEAEEKKLAEEERKRKEKKIMKVLAITIPSVIAVIVAIVITVSVISSMRYKEVAMSFGGDTISSGDYNTVGIKNDGTAVAIGNNGYGRCNVSDWKNIVAVSAGGLHTVGLKSDGTVVSTGDNNDGQCDVSKWKDIVAISAGGYHTVGLKSDGTVVATGHNYCGSCNVSKWKDIVAISAGAYHTVGLKSDGTVVATGLNFDYQCNVSKWKDIVAISAGGYHTVGLKSDGTVVATGLNYDCQCNVSDWKDIVAISAGGYHTVGLKSDGTVVAHGNHDDDQCNVFHWKDILVRPNNAR